jgi:hypothetical protein
MHLVPKICRIAPDSGQSFADNISTNSNSKLRQRLNGNQLVREERIQHDDPYLLDADIFLNRAASRLHIKKAFYWLNPNFFHAQAWFSWSAPQSYQPPGNHCKSPSSGDIDIHKHRDVFRRKHSGLNDARYLDPLDGRVQKLCVQTVNEIYDTENNTTWRRTYIENVSPYIIRLAYWPYSKMPNPNQNAIGDDSAYQAQASGIGTWKQEQWTHVGLRWLPACIGLLILVSVPLYALQHKSLIVPDVRTYGHRRPNSQSRIVRSCSIPILELP